MRDTAIVWFRNDLRLHDNEVLTTAINNAEFIVPVYVFDERIFSGKTSYGFRKTEVQRAKFIIECVEELRKSLQELGSNLIVRVGKPEEEITKIAEDFKASWVFCNRERTSEEVFVQDTLEQNLWHLGIEIFYTRGKMLYYTADLPFPILQAPDQFNSFRKEVERLVPIRKPLPAPKSIGSLHPKEINEGEIPDLKYFNYDKQALKASTSFKGGEKHALEQLHNFVWNRDGLGLKKFKSTRNNPTGWNTSSKLSPWLSTGCLSPKTVYYEVKSYEDKMGESENTYWMIFELLWRDYFRILGKKYGNKIFKINGIADQNKDWKENHEIFTKWCEGMTGIPFVDACLRQLKAEGFMSNKGRQNCASFLCKDLGINWIWGAEYFESFLLDYDPCSNYGNWNYIAGVGFDQMKDRSFDVIGQAKRFDPQGDYVLAWIPELKNIALENIHTPWLDTNFVNIDYPSPITELK